MKRILISLAYFAAFAFLLQPGVRAELLSGSVYSIDPLQNTITIEHQDNITGNSKQSVLTIVPTTVFSEYQTLDILKRGDLIWVETDPDSDGNLLAKGIEVVNA